ncbi:HrpE/YscL family type III secretion apparatus protein [Trinickia terrae]|uniref:Type 3 secretion system stator protein n=1 Tax=Trinickia terrae TaxID=2571161 RepID=A0A4U1I1C2_9BURK|nr:type III secretion system stator protein SctL [Trinickia terrae]TKC86936.1 HrpE/YscL family type III secretion apparatus protein [Trinickia terrae]
MVIWLRNPQAEGPEAGLGVGIAGDVLRGEDLATLVEIDAGYVEIRRQCDAALEAARDEAKAIVEAAWAQADALLAQARETYESAAERGYDDGFAQGLTDWHERAMQAHVDAQTLGRRRRDRLAELVALAAEQIVATADPAALFACAAKTVEQIVADGSPLQLSVHPSDLGAARAAFGEAARGWREAGRAVRLLVSADATLEPGACLIETDLGALDASLSHQLTAMRGALARAVSSVPEEDFAGDGLAGDEPAGDAEAAYASGRDEPAYAESGEDAYAGEDATQEPAAYADDGYEAGVPEGGEYAAESNDEMEAAALDA